MVLNARFGRQPAPGAFRQRMNTSAALTNVISPAIDYASQYMAVRVAYNPVGNAWTLEADIRTRVCSRSCQRRNLRFARFRIPMPPIPESI